MSEPVDENIRTYTFNVPGYIPGVPGRWSAGQWVKVNEDTKQVLDWGPKPVQPPALEQEQTDEPPAQQMGG